VGSPGSGERVIVTPQTTSIPEGKRTEETRHFQSYSATGSFLAAVPDLAERAEIIFVDVATRLPTSREQRIPVTFRAPPTVPCPPPGLASDRPTRIAIYTDDQTSRDQILRVLAHELDHILIMDRFDKAPRALNEGLATWASATYFSAWLGHRSLDAAVRSYVRDSTYLPLHQNCYRTGIDPGSEGSSASCVSRRETLYVGWASFLGYLIEEHGMEKLQAVVLSVPEPEMTNADYAIKPADFEAVTEAPLTSSRLLGWTNCRRRTRASQEPGGSRVRSGVGGQRSNHSQRQRNSRQRRSNPLQPKADASSTCPNFNPPRSPVP
jgi:hypothetical protein